MRRFLQAITVALFMVSVAVFAGCNNDNPKNAKITAQRLATTIERTCGTLESGRGAGDTGPRTVTAITDKESDQIGFVVTCVNGKTAFVQARGY